MYDKVCKFIAFQNFRIIVFLKVFSFKRLELFGFRSTSSIHQKESSVYPFIDFFCTDFPDQIKRFERLF